MLRDACIAALKEFYRREQCGQGGCRKAQQCFPQAGQCGPKEAFVGREFGTGRYPRLVILSLDPGSMDSETERSVDRVEDCTWKAVGKQKSRHWWRTLELVYSILGEKPVGEASDDEIARAVNWMAHLNSARCTQNKAHRRQADQLLFDNCREFAFAELECLRPEILITQGNQAWKVVAHLANAAPKSRIQASPVTYLRRFEIGGQVCKHVNLYHPSYLRGYARNRDDLVKTGVLRNCLVL